jgi:hypothetical protein
VVRRISAWKQTAESEQFSSFYATFALLRRISGSRTEGGRFGARNGRPIAGRDSAAWRFTRSDGA